jgi:hypothetical protein
MIVSLIRGVSTVMPWFATTRFRKRGARATGASTRCCGDSRSWPPVVELVGQSYRRENDPRAVPRAR